MKLQHIVFFIGLIGSFYSGKTYSIACNKTFDTSTLESELFQRTFKKFQELKQNIISPNTDIIKGIYKNIILSLGFSELEKKILRNRLLTKSPVSRQKIAQQLFISLSEVIEGEYVVMKKINNNLPQILMLQKTVSRNKARLNKKRYIGKTWATEEEIRTILKQKRITTKVQFNKQRTIDPELKRIPLPTSWLRIYGKTWKEVMGKKAKKNKKNLSQKSSKEKSLQ